MLLRHGNVPTQAVETKASMTRSFRQQVANVKKASVRRQGSHDFRQMSARPRALTLLLEESGASFVD
ncbi:hypothetical protein PsorP6_008230 [Peronosclerospora sorghi]|uniref:Uncharacterized protein n=1 Tax=Peronosclerospora sorghi TaxID=230839 RepID=A0ACC0W9Z1_9STRA|nr:hypothetical protein PsorP6_008230 [Peronosclerospora sorghi]